VFLISFIRADFTKEVIANIWAIPHTPIVIVQLASMKLVAYDAENAELYGRISLTSGVPGQRIVFSLVPAEEAVLHYTVPPLTEEEQQRLLEEAEEEASKAKGKKGKPGKEQAASQEELDLESIVAPEPSPYLLRKNQTGIACVSSQGFCGSFVVDQERAVISTFSTERLITFFCPGVASILRQLSMSTGAFDSSQPSALDIYRALSKEERNNENLKPSQVVSLQSLGGGGDELSGTSKHTQSQSTMKRTLGRSNTGSNLK
jgi:hypothetical protein